MYNLAQSRATREQFTPAPLARRLSGGQFVCVDVGNVTETVRIENNRIGEMWEDYGEYGMRIKLGLIKAN